MKPEQLDRRLFLRGFMLTSAGLVVPRPTRIFVPPAAQIEMLGGWSVEFPPDFNWVPALVFAGGVKPG